jgi:hypothetical protein
MVFSLDWDRRSAVMCGPIIPEVLDRTSAFFRCCRKHSKQTWSPTDLAFRTQTALQMAMLAHRQDKAARFDAEKQQIVV